MVLHHNWYDTARSVACLESNEGSFQTLREAQEVKTKTWKEAVQDSTTIGYMGRKNLSGAMRELGFKLL